MYTYENVNEVKDEESLGRKLYNKKKRTLFLSVAVVIYICTISFKSYRRGYEVGYNDAHNEILDRFMDKSKVKWTEF